jgi:predicted RNA binding protein YcfA (HicA-like mRNA interferase family)
MCLSLDEDGFEPALEDVPGPFMPAVEMLGVKAVQGLHSPAQRRARRLHQEVVVVSHQAIRVEEPGLVRDVIRLVRSDGWHEVRTAGSHRQFRHPRKGGVVTIAGKLGLDVPVGTLKSILKQAGLKS